MRVTLKNLEFYFPPKRNFFIGFLCRHSKYFFATFHLILECRVQRTLQNEKRKMAISWLSHKKLPSRSNSDPEVRVRSRIVNSSPARKDEGPLDTVRTPKHCRYSRWKGFRDMISHYFYYIFKLSDKIASDSQLPLENRDTKFWPESDWLCSRPYLWRHRFALLVLWNF